MIGGRTARVVRLSVLGRLAKAQAADVTADISQISLSITASLL